MRYIGSKEKVIPFIENVIFDTVGNIKGAIVADLFSGTVAVAKHFKRLGAKLITNDYMAFSYAFQIAFIRNNYIPCFSELSKNLKVTCYKDILTYLTNLHDHKGFFYKEYCLEGSRNSFFQRNYFSDFNARKIDSIRVILNEWYKNDLINQDEFYILLSSLIEAVTKVSNISGTYGAFLKFDERRKYKELELMPIEIINSDHEHICHCKDILELITCVAGDILYLDPPYNQRQYPPYYHILETLTLYDNPKIYGKTGRRPYKDKLSPFCVKNKTSEALDYLIRKAKFKHIFLSYNTQRILTKEEVYRILTDIGYVELFEQDYRRYKSNNNGTDRGNLKELIFYVRK